ncbi:hypothetical protein HNQ72_001566 [Rhizobium wenxiniae]|uniref:Uncharacterized protein n=1 Tax=Rhizobium wenxiniae TaxID=1737357 RepID=A0A7X0CYZ0_9HYPH|nr:hypothetical protein [Rhizobium wenxiniae]
MFHMFGYLRGHIYPRSQMLCLAGAGQLRGSDAILGIMAVMLAVVAVAGVIEIVLF